MRSYFIVASTVAVLSVAFASIAIRPAAAFTADQNGVTQAATATSPTIEVKRSPHKSKPPGWSHGRKTGWHGSSRPPGQH
jgi:hypothetical protein